MSLHNQSIFEPFLQIDSIVIYFSTSLKHLQPADAQATVTIQLQPADANDAVMKDDLM